jgi:hypothetical protein
MWFPRATPGRTHDLTAARAHGIVQACLTRQILILADRAYQGAGAPVRTPYYHHSEQPEHYQQFNRDHTRLRASGERAFAQLKSWRILREARCSTRCISRTVQAIHTLLTCDYSDERGSVRFGRLPHGTPGCTCWAASLLASSFPVQDNPIGSLSGNL